MIESIPIQGTGSKALTQLRAAPPAGQHWQVRRFIGSAFGSRLTLRLYSGNEERAPFVVRGDDDKDRGDLHVNCDPGDSLQYAVECADENTTWLGYLEVEAVS